MGGKIIELLAAKKWGKIPPDVKQMLINNVYCSKCGVTTIVDYSMYNKSYGILLQGKCKKCGGRVARLVDDD